MAEPKGASVTKALNAAWVRPFVLRFLIWIANVHQISLLKINPDQKPAPGEVVARLLTDCPEQQRAAGTPTYTTHNRLRE